jgi:hypothetical protein
LAFSPRSILRPHSFAVSSLSRLGIIPPFFCRNVLTLLWLCFGILLEFLRRK